MATMNAYGLTDLQWRFVQEYLIEPNATAAYERAGYKARGAVSRANASRLLTNANVAAAIENEQAKRAERTGITQDAVLHEIAILQHSTVEHYTIDDRGNVGLALDAPRDAMRAVASLKKKVMYTDTGMTYETEIKLWNKPASLRMGGEHLGIFKGIGDVPLSDIHVHIHTARERLSSTLGRLAQRHAGEATNGHK